jgi:hypothetical protein
VAGILSACVTASRAVASGGKSGFALGARAREFGLFHHPCRILGVSREAGYTEACADSAQSSTPETSGRPPAKSRKRRSNNGAAADENAQLKVSKPGLVSACAVSRLSAKR